MLALRTSDPAPDSLDAGDAVHHFLMTPLRHLGRHGDHALPFLARVTLRLRTCCYLVSRLANSIADQWVRRRKCTCREVASTCRRVAPARWRVASGAIDSA